MYNQYIIIKKEYLLWKRKLSLALLLVLFLSLGILGVNSVKQEPDKVATWHHPLLDYKIQFYSTQKMNLEHSECTWVLFSY